MEQITKEQAKSNLKQLVDVCVKNGNIFDKGEAVVIMLQCIEVLSAEPETPPEKEQ